MNGYLAKPLQPRELLAEVERLGRPAGRKTAATDSEAAAGDSSLLDEVGGDAQLLEEICGLFARESAGQMAALRAAVERGDREGFARATHTLRGMLRSVHARAAEQQTATLQPLDPCRERDRALLICEGLEQSLGALREQFATISADPARSVVAQRRLALPQGAPDR